VGSTGGICRFDQKSPSHAYKKVSTSLKYLPGEFELDELIERLILLQKIKNGLEQELYRRADGR